MGECLDFWVGERVDMYAELKLGLEAQRGYYEARFPGEVTYVWDEFIDVRAGEQVFRVSRGCLRERMHGRWEFISSDAELIQGLEDYDPESEIDFDGIEP